MRAREASGTTDGNQQFVLAPALADRHLVAFTLADLCGRGQVLGLGTWDFRLGGQPADTREFVTCLLRWLATGTPTLAGTGP